MEQDDCLVESESPVSILQKYFGFDTFREPQQSIIESVLAKQDALVCMPTGGGKSLCYQIPALILKGVTIVISPLIALMEDQVFALKKRGLRADFYNSSLNGQQAKAILHKLHNNDLDLLYVAPERLISNGFLERLQSCEISLFAIDEAHCISEWGLEFRPEYASLGILKKYFPNTPLIALTASATTQTKKDIINKLDYQPEIFQASFNRKNIYYEVQYKDNPLPQLDRFLRQYPNEPGIVYCSTRAGAEKIAVALMEKGYKARAYHAGLMQEERRMVQRMFINNQINIIVATIAFGMGIDKANIRFIIHFNLPKTIENYYQETGRSGRGGQVAHALLLLDMKDYQKQCRHIEEITSKSQRSISRAKLDYMLKLAQTKSCRRQLLLEYFSECLDSKCGFCDNCDNPPKLTDATIEAQKALSCIYRLKQKFGVTHTIDVLRGSQSEKIKKFGHDTLSTYGIGKDRTTQFWKNLIQQLIAEGFCEQNPNNHNVLVLTSKSKAILTQSTPFLMSN